MNFMQKLIVMKNKLYFLLLFITSSFLSYSQSVPEENFKISFSQDRIILPLTYRRGANPVVEVMINNKGPYRFMFDTGCGGMARLDTRLFNEWKLPVTDSILTSDGLGSDGRYYPVTI